MTFLTKKYANYLSIYLYNINEIMTFIKLFYIFVYNVVWDILYCYKILTIIAKKHCSTKIKKKTQNI
jgi:hypothetical protein